MHGYAVKLVTYLYEVPPIFSKKNISSTGTDTERGSSSMAKPGFLYFVTASDQTYDLEFRKIQLILATFEIWSDAQLVASTSQSRILHVSHSGATSPQHMA